VNAPEAILGISTAGPVEVSVLGRGRDIALSSSGGALESLTALTSLALESAGCAIDEITLIGVCTGPGSFTGLRIGVAFAKSLAQAADKPIVGISTYDVVAYNVTAFPIISVARGKRDYYYARVLTARGSEPRFIQGSRDIINHAGAEVATGGRKATIVGPDFSVARPGDAARAVAQLARLAAQSADRIDWTNIVIDYGQRPNAVVNWEKRQQANEEGPPL
jgi:tRNA threonylcarbamoyl adenosine modification protein YeaZ